MYQASRWKLKVVSCSSNLELFSTGVKTLNIDRDQLESFSYFGPCTDT